MDTIAQDVRFAARTLVRRPGFAAVAVLTLAIGIAANSAIFSLVESLLLRPLPFRDPERLALVWERNVPRSRERNVVGPYNFLRWRERTRAFEAMAAFAPWRVNVTGEGEPERVETGAVTGDLFALLGVGAIHGRPLLASDSEPGAPDVVVLSEGYWRRRFGGDPAAVGRRIVVGGEPATVVGVVAQSFRIPPKAEMWLPLEVDAEMRAARGRWMAVIGRLRPGVTIAQAQDEMERIGAGLVQENPDFNTGWSVDVRPLHADMVRDIRPALVVLMGAVGLLLLLGCVNVANLLLARAVSREREIAIRTALGAGAFRLVRQLLTESLLLSVAGGALGLLLGQWMLQGLAAMLPAEIPLIVPIELTARVAGFALGLSVVSAAFFGLAPALSLSRPALVPALKEGGAVRGTGTRRLRLKNSLVVAEVALSLLLAAGAGLFVRSFHRLSTVDPGFDPQGVVTLQLDLPRLRYPEGPSHARFFTEAVERLRAIPGVRAAGGISWMPLGLGTGHSFRPLDRPEPPPGQEPAGEVRFVTPGLFHAMGIPLLAGRDFSPHDAAGQPYAVIANARTAERFWPGQSALGKRIGMEWGGLLEAEVVGVVGDVRLTSLDTAARETLYWPVQQVPNSFMTLMVKTDGPFDPVVERMRREVRAMDADLPLGRLRPLEDVVSESLQRQRLVLVLIGAFATAALLLAAVGIYGVMSFAVQQRIPEVGVRMALGARPADVLGLVLKQALAVGAVGIALGLAGALAAGSALATLLYDISPRDPIALAAVAGTLLLVVLAASFFPARRAARVDPLEALRTE